MTEEAGIGKAGQRGTVLWCFGLYRQEKQYEMI